MYGAQCLRNQPGPSRFSVSSLNSLCFFEIIEILSCLSSSKVQIVSERDFSDTPPFLKIVSFIYLSGSSSIFRTVDSIPKEHQPPSKTVTSLSLQKSSYTCYAFEGDTWPNLFADGAAIGQFDYLSNSNAISWFGILNPTYPVSAVINFGIISKFALTTRVSGPGQ